MDAAESGNLQLKIESNMDAGARSSLEMPEKDLLTRYLVSIQRYLNERDSLYFRNTLDTIIQNFPGVTSAEELAEIDKAIQQIEHGNVPLNYNGKDYTAKDIFFLISHAGYFDITEDAQKLYSEMVQVPFTGHLLWHIFLGFAFDFHNIISALFDLVKRVENHNEYGPLVAERRAEKNHCIYCRSEIGDFRSEEHIIPESLCGDYAFLPCGFVCDRCNNGVCANLDQRLQGFEPVAFLRVQHGPFGKDGKAPRVEFNNVIFERTGPREITVTAKDDTGGLKETEVYDDGSIGLNTTFKGRRFDWPSLGRSIYKIGLGMVAFDMGHEAALDPKFDAARDYILNGGGFDNGMIVSFGSKVNPHIRTSLDNRFGGTGFMIDIFGMIFMINLETEPKLLDPTTFKEPEDAVFEQFNFRLFSLKNPAR